MVYDRGVPRSASRHDPSALFTNRLIIPAFMWAVNTSTGVVDVALNLSSQAGRRSVVRYMPQTHHDFGELLCWAANRVGQQRRPCVFRVIPAAKPEAVHGCRTERNSSMPSSYAVIRARRAGTGGLNQTFTLEVRQRARQEVLEAFRHAPTPLHHHRGVARLVEVWARVQRLPAFDPSHQVPTRFILAWLKIGAEYLLTVTAANSRGSSPPVTLNYTATAASADKVVSPHATLSLGHHHAGCWSPSWAPWWGVSACVAVGVLLVRRWRGRRKSRAKILYGAAEGRP
ncbi:hypothetical protein GWK47_047727 [Chionoecetes opilio]|uniref:Uncharacterized protein n=1 Tax=Chionoecetes opilio TaxID=41210 RepID=A0A8J4YDD0_CHIOP|nr:hypothetical protein GWK47_047727 [Chionoecetes opilio]